MKFKVNDMRMFVKSLFESFGLPDKYSQSSMEVIMQAELTGVLTHGLAKLPFYANRYKNKTENIAPEIRIINNHVNNVLLDGDNASGLVVGPEALNICINRTKKSGIVSIAIKNSGHFGCGNYYTWRFAKENLIGIVMTNSAPLMAPYGGKKREIGTNPISIGIPARNEKPIILDMASSVAAYGKIQIAAMENKKIPLDWARNIEGMETDNPNEALKGTLQPLAKHKGYGLAVIVDCLTSLLSCGEFGDKITGIDGLNEKTTENISHFMLGIDPSTFYELDKFIDYVDFYIRYIKKSPKAKGNREIFLPGEIEFNKYDKNMNEGLLISENTCKKLFDMINDIGINPNNYQNFEEYMMKSFC